MRQSYVDYIRAAIVMAVGLLAGLTLTAISLRSGHGFGALHVGSWTAWPRTGGADIDPYARAILARSGEAPLGRDQGLVFIAREDATGAPLNGRCEYVVSGAVPPARFWTLSLTDPSGVSMLDMEERLSFTSGEILRKDGGSFEIAIARKARPGNWLSPGPGRDFVLALRLYDTPLDVEARLDQSGVPQITRLDCP